MTSPAAGTALSPCIGICRINPHSRLCEGCRRTLTEIAEWMIYAEDRRHAIIAALPDRDPFSHGADET